MQGERQEQFFDRAMRALAKSVASINRRTVEVLSLWCASVNDQDLRDKAFLQFPEDQFKHYAPRCVFLEHTVPASADGSREAIVYDRTALQQLVNWANYRIRNSDNFAAISDGHTPTAAERQAGHKMPEVLGYSGPFYLGLLGDVDPKWAIYADEWVHIDDIPRFNKLQRRSPEVWVNEPIENRTMDPIAALGAETPRLDSGMNPYCRLESGHDVYRELEQSELIMRYSASTFPGPSNTFIPGSEKGRKQRYGVSTMPPMNQNPADQAQDAPDIGEAVARAIQSVMPTIVQAVQQEMSGGSPDAGDDDGGPPQPGESAPVPDEPRGGTPDAGGPQKPPGDDEDARYKAQGPAIYGAYCAGKRSTMQYSRNGDVDPSFYKRLAKLEVDNRKLTSQLTEERNARQLEQQDTMRYARLVELSRDHDFDPAEEMKTVIEFTDEQFQRHCDATVAKYARRDDVTNLQIFDDPTAQADHYNRTGSAHREPTVAECEQYSRMAADEAARKNSLKRGSTTFVAEYDALMAKAFPESVAS